VKTFGDGSDITEQAVASYVGGAGGWDDAHGRIGVTGRGAERIREEYDHGPGRRRGVGALRPVEPDRGVEMDGAPLLELSDL
jgi:hypothetical protein